MEITQATIENVFKSKKASIETMEAKGYELLEELFCDSSGFGSENEPAFTINGLKKKLQEFCTKYGTVYTSITGAGQFQVYVAVFKKGKEKKSRVIARNTLEIWDNGTRIIRLYDTNILSFVDGRVTIDNGGFCTRTTHDRMNKFLPTKMYVYAKNGETVIYNSGKKIKTENKPVTIRL